MSTVRGYFKDLVAGARILVGRDFWRAFADYWRPSAVAARMDAYSLALSKRTCRHRGAAEVTTYGDLARGYRAWTCLDCDTTFTANLEAGRG
jgi:hypothetical protein